LTDEELFVIQRMNLERYNLEKEAIYAEYCKMDEFIMEGLKKNAKHQHFSTKKKVKEAMLRDNNPFNTFSSGKNMGEAIKAGKLNDPAT